MSFLQSPGRRVRFLSRSFVTGITHLGAMVSRRLRFGAIAGHGKPLNNLPWNILGVLMPRPIHESSSIYPAKCG